MSFIEFLNYNVHLPSSFPQSKLGTHGDKSLSKMVVLQLLSSLA